MCVRVEVTFDFPLVFSVVLIKEMSPSLFLWLQGTGRWLGSVRGACLLTVFGSHTLCLSFSTPWPWDCKHKKEESLTPRAYDQSYCWNVNIKCGGERKESEASCLASSHRIIIRATAIPGRSADRLSSHIKVAKEFQWSFSDVLMTLNVADCLPVLAGLIEIRKQINR